LLATVEKNPRRQGFAFTRWTTPRLATFLELKTGIRLSPRGIAEVLHQHDFVWRKAKLTTRNKADEGEKKTRPVVATLHREGRRAA
jgi:transposase